MSLTVGTDTYVSLADADTYWESYAGGTNWADATDPNKEKALREATQFVDKSYHFVGDHTGLNSQVLAWPRYNAIDKQGRSLNSTDIPHAVKDAVSYLAEQALGASLLQSKDRGGAIRKVKAGSVEVEYEENSITQKSFPYADLLLREITDGSSSVRRLLKA